MSDFDYLSLSGRNLKAFLAVVEEGSVTRAAARLGLTQSAVSHTLERLRSLVGDPLFVRSGRNVVPTARALVMAERARQVVDGFHDLASSGEFRPQGARLRLVVAANDLQRDVLLPSWLDRLRADGAEVALRVISSGRPTAAVLREGRADLLLTPRPPDGADIVQKRLFVDEYVCFYDAARRGPPADLADYLAAVHLSIVFDDNEPTAFDVDLRERGLLRHIRVTVPGFSGIPAFLRGSDALASLPSLLGRGVMADFAWAPLPFPHAGLPMYMVWHVRHQHDQRHAWLRAVMERVAGEVGSGLRSAPDSPWLMPANA